MAGGSSFVQVQQLSPEFSDEFEQSLQAAEKDKEEQGIGLIVYSYFESPQK